MISPRARARLAYVAMFAAIGAQAPYFVLYYQLRGFSLATIGPIVAASSIAGLVAAPLWGALSDRLRGAPGVILAPMLLALAGVTALWGSTEVLPVALSVTMIAAGMAGVAPIVEARGLETSGHDRSGYGPLRAFGSGSYIAAAGLIGIGVQQWGVGAALASFAVGVALTGLIGLTLRPASRRDVAVAAGETVVVAARPGLREIRRLLAIPSLAIFLVGAALAWTTVSAVVAYYALRLTELGAPATYVGVSAALAAGVEIPIMLGYPWLAARVRPQRLIVAGVVFLALRALLAGTLSDPLVLVAINVFGGLGFALMLVGGVTFVSRLAPPELQATAQGVFQGMTTSVGAITGGALAAVLGGTLGLAGLYVFVSMLGFVAAGIVAVATRMPPRSG